jgi:hypothetical protein
LFIDNPDHQFGNGSVWTQTRTQSAGPEPLLTLLSTLIAIGSRTGVMCQVLNMVQGSR